VRTLSAEFGCVLALAFWSAWALRRGLSDNVVAPLYWLGVALVVGFTLFGR
jgi:hypothetical protein